MDAVRVLVGLLCLAFAGGSGVFNSGAVRDDKGKGSERVEPFRLREKWDGAAAVVRAAEKEIGVREDAENAGARVDMYNAYAGLKKVAWCASFVSWCHGQAGYPQPRTAWSPALFPAHRLSKVAVRGGVLGIYYEHLGRIGHCGIVVDVRNDLVYSVEGNTNVSGSREGDGVYRKIRHRRTIATYARWTERGAE